LFSAQSCHSAPLRPRALAAQSPLATAAAIAVAAAAAARAFGAMATRAELEQHEIELLADEAPAVLDNAVAPPRAGRTPFLFEGRSARAAGLLFGVGALLAVGALGTRVRTQGTVQRADVGSAVGMEQTLDQYFSSGVGEENAAAPITAVANTTDGNPCMDDEEYFNNLCYKKCSILTQGSNPVRTSAWTCCEKKPCGFSNTKHDVGMCSGFSVGGGNRKACPHAAGSCLENEEFFLGQCYKKCSILTNNEYPNRMMSGTCCKTKGKSCFFPSNVKSSTDYNIGGGKDDGNSNTPAKPHPPIPALTEGASSSVTPVVTTPAVGR